MLRRSSLARTQYTHDCIKQLLRMMRRHPDTLATFMAQPHVWRLWSWMASFVWRQMQQQDAANAKAAAQRQQNASAAPLEAVAVGLRHSALLIIFNMLNSIFPRSRRGRSAT